MFHSTPKTITIQLTKGYSTVADECDSDLAKFNWCINGAPPNTYARRTTKDGQSIYLHRMILERILGRPLASAEYVDHINGDKLDNQRINLRLCTSSQNQANRKKTKNASGYKGVWRYPGREKQWVANIKVNRKKISLGYYYTPEEAYAAYCEAAKHYFGEFARLE